LRVGCDGVVLSENRLAQGFHQCCELCRSFGNPYRNDNGVSRRSTSLPTYRSTRENRIRYHDAFRLTIQQMRPQTGGIRIVAVWVSFAAFDACHPIPAKQPRPQMPQWQTPIHRFRRERELLSDISEGSSKEGDGASSAEGTPFSLLTR